MTRTRLILNADDFGASTAVNDAVIDAHRRGVLTSCSLMASGEAFDDAVRRAAEQPTLGVGLHLVAVHGRSVLPHGEIPSLVDRSGRFPNDPTWAGLHYYFSPKARRELRRELSAQLEKALAAGIRLSHLDAHLHLHVHPVMFDLAVELGKQASIRRIRVPEDDPALARRFAGPMAVGRSAEAKIFRVLTRRMKRRLRAEGFAFTDRVYGHLMTGRMSESYLLFLLDHLPTGSSEIYSHPALHDASSGLSPTARQAVREYEALVSPRVFDRLDRLEVERIPYGEL